MDSGAGETALVRDQHGRHDAEIDGGILPQRTSPRRQPQHEASIQCPILFQWQLRLQVSVLGWIGSRDSCG
jgi:hypothetical protein